jgi:alkaline phosphatase D
MTLDGKSSRLNRRQFLVAVLGAAAAGAAVTTGCADDGGDTGPVGSSSSTRPSTGTAAPGATTTVDAATLPVPDLAAPFTLGVASGDPYPTQVILWTRLAPDPLAGGGMPDVAVPVRWEVATDDTFTDLVASGVTVAEPAFGHSVHVDATGLEPSTWYRYRFMVGDPDAGGHVSPVGQTRTMPGPRDVPDRFAFAFASCQAWQDGYYTAYPHLVAENLDAMLFLGDYIYEGGVNPDALRQHDGDEIITLADYRNRYALYRSDDGLRAAHARCPWIVTWDDHEVDNDYADLVPEPGAPPVDFTARRAAAYQAWWEHMPVRLEPPDGADLRIHRGFDVGQLARIYVLDTRQERDDQTCDDGSGLPVAPQCDDARSDQRTILGGEQRSWLVDGIANANTEWHVLANQVVFSHLPIAGNLFNMDQWDGYAADRQVVLDALAAHGKPAIVVTGDIHLSGVGQLTAVADDPDSDPVGGEFVATGISSRFGDDLAPIVEAVADTVPTIKYVNARQQGYVTVELTPAEARVAFRLVDTVDEPTSAITTDASFVLGQDRVVRPG